MVLSQAALSFFSHRIPHALDIHDGPIFPMQAAILTASFPPVTDRQVRCPHSGILSDAEPLSSRCANF